MTGTLEWILSLLLVAVLTAVPPNPDDSEKEVLRFLRSVWRRIVGSKDGDNSASSGSPGPLIDRNDGQKKNGWDSGTRPRGRGGGDTDEKPELSGTVPASDRRDLTRQLLGFNLRSILLLLAFALVVMFFADDGSLLGVFALLIVAVVIGRMVWSAGDALKGLLAPQASGSGSSSMWRALVRTVGPSLLAILTLIALAKIFPDSSFVVALRQAVEKIIRSLITWIA